MVLEKSAVTGFNDYYSSIFDISGEQTNSYVRLLFTGYSSAYNTVIPMKLLDKLPSIGLQPSDTGS